MGAPQAVHFSVEIGAVGARQIDGIVQTADINEPTIPGGAVIHTEVNVNGPPRAWDISFRVSMY